MAESKAVAAALWLALAAAPAWACRCPGEPRPAVAYRGADLVLLAKAQAVEGDIESEGGARVLLQPAQAWKATVPPTVEVVTRSTCAFDFHAGESYLVYLKRSASTGYETAVCMGNRPQAEAAQALNWLRRHGAVTMKPR